MRALQVGAPYFIYLAIKWAIGFGTVSSVVWYANVCVLVPCGN